MVNLQQQLQHQLRDIHLPKPISWWPLAPGWWILMAIILILLAVSGFYSWRWWKKRQYKKQILKQFNQHCEQNDFSKAMLLVKVVTQHLYPTDNSLQLFGRVWFEYLSSKTNASSLTTSEITRFTDLVYRPAGSANSKDYSWFRTWLEQQL